jgi:hypothetical protein
MAQKSDATPTKAGAEDARLNINQSGQKIQPPHKIPDD